MEKQVISGVFVCDYYSRLFKNRAKNKCREAVRSMVRPMEANDG